jgi:membrane protein
VGGARLKSSVRRAVAALKRYARSVWSRDRASLTGWRALTTRIGRIVAWSVRGLVVNKLSLQSAALAYYTLFSIVPVLVVVLWVLKLCHLIPHLMPAAGRQPVGSGAHLPDTNLLLRTAARAILASVERAGKLEAGLVGLGALAYGVVRQIVHVEAAMNAIAGAGQRPRHRWRMLGYLALLVLPPALRIVSGLLRGLSNLPVGSTLARALSWLLAVVPLLKSAVAVVIGLAILCLALTIFYASASRARIALRSTVVGAAAGAVLLAAVLWAFARLQIGVSRAGALQSGMAAVPVFLLWAHSSWLVILLGAQVAVAHELDAVLTHGTRAWSLGPYEQAMAGVQIMGEVARHESARRGASGDAGAASVTTDELARELRLLPNNVRDVADRLRLAGMLRGADGSAYRLACDPNRTSLQDVVGAMAAGGLNGAD